MEEDDRRGYERRREDQETLHWREELAAWRGGIDARMGTVESDIRDLVKQCGIIDRTVTRVEGRVESLQREFVENHAETRELAGKISSARDEVVREFKAKSSADVAHSRALRLTAFQILIGAIVAIAVATIPTLLTLAITGQLH